MFITLRTILLHMYTQDIETVLYNEYLMLIGLNVAHGAMGCQGYISFQT